MNISRVLCPLVNIAAAIKTAFEILEGKLSIACDIHVPPKSCPTKITYIKFQKQKEERENVRDLFKKRKCSDNLSTNSDSNIK